VDLVLVSHKSVQPSQQLSETWTHVNSHFDHLDPEAIHELGDSCEWIVPIGVGPFIREHGVTRVTELE
jgi:N-acyl-phosphatidylethanolamine-hydrolysing phospholipase D